MAKKLIGLYQLLAGTFGIIFLSFSFLTKSNEIANSQAVTSQLITGVLLYGLLAWMGYGLMNDLRRARSISIVLQIMQIPVIYIKGTIYKFTAAGFISLGIKNNLFAFDYTLRPIDFAILSNYGNETRIMVYIVPIIFLIALLRSK